MALKATLCSIAVIVILCAGRECRAQCSVQAGPPPPLNIFSTTPLTNTWTVATDDINGPYIPTVMMSPVPAGYYAGGASWISFSTSGEHTSNRFFFYKMSFDLPCFNNCGKSYNDANTFCLQLDLYADNSIYEVYVNGVAQSSNGVGIVAYADPYNPAGHTTKDKTAVTLCQNWKAGTNTIIIQVASSATLSGLQVEYTKMPPVKVDTVNNTICEGSSIVFGGQPLSEAGYYSTTYTGVNGCDSTRVLHLQVTNLPEPTFEGKPVVCAGDSLVLFPGSFASYQWQDGSSGDHFTAKSPGLYSVTVTNSCGSASKSIVVTGGLCGAYFPNAFTPNNNRTNETFKILTDLNFTFYYLVIYNRWGQKVFETNNAKAAWDGKVNGSEQPAGAYVWMCRMSRGGSTSSLKGLVMLLR